MKYILLCLAGCCMSAAVQAQPAITGRVYDAITLEPVQSALVTGAGGLHALTNEKGIFSIPTTGKLTIAAIGFRSYILTVTSSPGSSGAAVIPVPLERTVNELQQVVISASRTAEKRSEAPVAITVIGRQVIEETKAQRLDQLVNKVSGVFMVNLGNEQHEMSIRQPMTTSSRFLYMEDGIPLRTTGVYNHNALLEMNMTAVRSLEVIKGPSSALYGGEAIGGAVNAITLAAPSVFAGSLSAQLNNTGYRRADAMIGGTWGRTGLLASGYYAERTNGPIEHSDYHKKAITLRADQQLGSGLNWTNTLTYIDYYSDMTGALDSAKFADRNFSSLQSFTYRVTNALRFKSILTKEWNAKNTSSLSFLYRNNSVKQNPSYSIASTSDPSLYKGQVNDNSFRAYAMFLQHVTRFDALKGKLVAGASLDFSPQTYRAQFIWIRKDGATNKFASYFFPSQDSLLSNYATNISNAAAYADFAFEPLKRIRITAALRYDAFRYDFRNALPQSASTGAPSSVTVFSRATPKIGFTYNLAGAGFYANYSEGYVPPQITELFNSVSVPYLQPQTFYNYEAGGWVSLVNNTLNGDWSIYLMNGRNEIITVKQPDGSYINQNAGETRHYGIEYGLTYRPSAQWQVRVSATNAKHVYVSNIVKGVDFSGKEISAAPRFFSNAELTCRPSFVKGLRLSVEWQHQGAYFMDDLNAYRYSGFDVVNIRAAYHTGRLEVWTNLLNAFNQYYSTLATKGTSAGNASYSYNLGDPAELTLGCSITFGKKYADR